jgi:hypothetical protein
VNLLIKYSKRLQRRLDRDVYPDLNTLPIANWWKINSTNNYAYLLRVNRDVSEREYTILEGKYDDLMEDYIVRYGMNDQLNDVLEKQREIALMRIDLILKNDPSLQTLIEVAEIELNELVKSQEGMSYQTLKAIIDKVMGFQINENTTSVVQFQSYIELTKQHG